MWFENQIITDDQKVDHHKSSLAKIFHEVGLVEVEVDREGSHIIDHTQPSENPTISMNPKLILLNYKNDKVEKVRQKGH